VTIFTKFHEHRAKILELLLMANFEMCALFIEDYVVFQNLLFRFIIFLQYFMTWSSSRLGNYILKAHKIWLHSWHENGCQINCTHNFQNFQPLRYTGNTSSCQAALVLPYSALNPVITSSANVRICDAGVLTSLLLCW